MLVPIPPWAFKYHPTGNHLNGRSTLPSQGSSHPSQLLVFPHSQPGTQSTKPILNPPPQYSLFRLTTQSMHIPPDQSDQPIVTVCSRPPNQCSSHPSVVWWPSTHSMLTLANRHTVHASPPPIWWQSKQRIFGPSVAAGGSHLRTLFTIRINYILFAHCNKPLLCYYSSSMFHFYERNSIPSPFLSQDLYFEPSSSCN